MKRKMPNVFNLILVRLPFEDSIIGSKLRFTILWPTHFATDMPIAATNILQSMVLFRF